MQTVVLRLCNYTVGRQTVGAKPMAVQSSETGLRHGRQLYLLNLFVLL
jgi:hypothetical protein